MNREVVSFGRFQLDLGQRQLVLDGKPVPLGRRALDILCVLAATGGKPVSKDELMARVWHGVVVEENNIQVHVSALRKAMDAEGSGQSYVVTVPGRGYRLIGVKSSLPTAVDSSDNRSSSDLRDKPSVAVLPFLSMGVDPAQEYFADGMVEEIITALSRFSGLFVIARNSCFTYKGRMVNVKQVGRELGVRYVLDGSVRRTGDRVRITGQLVDAATGAHLWAHRFDGEIDDIFAVQEQISAKVVGAIAPRLEFAEIERVKGKPTESLDAYDCYLRGKASFHQWRPEANDEALRSFYHAIEVDPDFAAAYGMASLCYAQRKMNGWMSDPPQESSECAKLVERAVELGRDDAVALSGAGLALLRVLGDFSAAGALVEQSLMLNPNLAQALYASSFVKNCEGEPEAALQRLKQVMELSPVDPLMYLMCTGTALAHFQACRYDEATSWAKRALREKPNYYPAMRMAAASNALAGRLDHAKDIMVRLRRLDPTLRISHLSSIMPLRSAEIRDRYAGALRIAGLPE